MTPITNRQIMAMMLLETLIYMVWVEILHFMLLYAPVTIIPPLWMPGFIVFEVFVMIPMGLVACIFFVVDGLRARK